jgi:hypothetical protein
MVPRHQPLVSTDDTRRIHPVWSGTANMDRGFRQEQSTSRSLAESTPHLSLGTSL